MKHAVQGSSALQLAVLQKREAGSALCLTDDLAYGAVPVQKLVLLMVAPG